MSKKNLWWGKPIKSRRFHIFEGDRYAGSLCGNWMFTNDGHDPDVDIENDSFNEGKDCKKCARKAGIIDE